MLEDLSRLIESGFTQLVAILGIVWWSRKIDLRTQDHAERLDRHEQRLRDAEKSHHAHAVLLARMDETLSGMKLTLDRIYNEVSEGRKQP